MSEAHLPAVTGYALGDEVVLFLEHAGQLLRLNGTASHIWRSLESGQSAQEIAKSLAEASGAPLADVERDVMALVTGLREAALPGEGPVPAPHSAEPPPGALPETRGIWRLPHPGTAGRERSYRLVDFEFRLRTPSAAIDLMADALLAHLALPDRSSPEVSLEIVGDEDRWLLLRDGAVVDECSTSQGVVPMLHANVLLMAYQGSNCMAALHAAAVVRGDGCILVLGASGGGKSTLAAALVSGGFEYAADDLVLLTDEPIRVRGVPTCLGLKAGSWKILDRFFPEIRRLPEHLRADGKKVRYLPPPGRLSGGRDFQTARAIVFPLYSPGAPVELAPLTSAEGFARLTASGYDLPGRITRRTVQRLIAWIAGVPCLELRYDAPEDAVAAISALVS